MLAPPEDLAEPELRAAVTAQWSIVAESVEYAPVGFGSHHWVLAERGGRRWFVTGDAVVKSDQRLADLAAAIRTAHALRHRCGLETADTDLAWQGSLSICRQLDGIHEVADTTCAGERSVTRS